VLICQKRQFVKRMPAKFGGDLKISLAPNQNLCATKTDGSENVFI
jgi:hypothetical protein